MFGVALGAAIIMGSLVLQTRNTVDDERQAWRAIAGPPCPEVVEPPAKWKGGRYPIKSFDFQGVRFWRKYGDAECSVVRDRKVPPGRYVACQFLSPSLLGVERGGRTDWFAPPIGTTATLRVTAKGRSCVLGGWLSR